MNVICGIYKFTNKVNGKIYIGQSVDVVHRKYSHFHEAFKKERLSYNSYFHKAIRKYGKENFTFEIIERCDRSELNVKEIYWIDYYKSFKEEYGYNISLGGHYAKHLQKPVYQIDIKTKQVVNEYPSLKEASLSVNGYIGALSQVCTGKLTSAYDYIWCFKENYRDGMYENYKRKKQYREIYAIDKITHKIVKKYSSIVEAEKEVNGKTSVIIQVCNGDRKSCYGYIWCYADEYYDGKYDNYDLDIQQRGVYKFDKDTNELLGTYKSLSEAVKSVGKTNKSMIAFACKGKTKTAYGYKWGYIR